MQEYDLSTKGKALYSINWIFALVVFSGIVYEIVTSNNLLGDINFYVILLFFVGFVLYLSAIPYHIAVAKDAGLLTLKSLRSTVIIPVIEIKKIIERGSLYNIRNNVVWIITKSKKLVILQFEFTDQKEMISRILDLGDGIEHVRSKRVRE